MNLKDYPKSLQCQKISHVINNYSYHLLIHQNYSNFANTHVLGKEKKHAVYQEKKQHHTLNTIKRPD